MDGKRAILLLTINGTVEKIPVEEGSVALRILQKAVDGRIELIHPAGLIRPYVMAVNEEGWSRRLEKNLVASWLCCHVILGPAAILMEEYTEDGEIDLLGLPPK